MPCIPRYAIAAAMVLSPVLCTTAALPQAHAQEEGRHESYNLQVVVTESLANRLLSQNHSEVGDVRDVIIGADVYGRQVTTAQSTIDFQPCTRGALLEFVLNGVTLSDTVGVTPQAMVHTCGRHRFRIAKPVYFDGTRFFTRQPQATVQPRNDNRAARTPLSDVPLLGHVAEHHARQVAESRRLEAETEAAAHLGDRLIAKFNREADGRLARANGYVRDTLRPAQSRLGLSFATESLSTSHTQLWYGVRSGPVARETATPDLLLQPSEAAVIVVHESLLNALLDRLSLSDKSFTDRQMSGFETKLKQWLGIPVDPEEQSDPAGGDAPQLYTVLLDETDPMRATLNDGTLTLTVRASFQPVLGNQIPLQRITIRLRPVLNSTGLRLEADPVEVAPADDAEPGLAQQMIGQMIQSRLKPLELSREFPLSIPEGRSARLTIARIEIAAGWLMVTVR